MLRHARWGFSPAFPKNTSTPTVHFRVERESMLNPAKTVSLVVAASPDAIFASCKMGGLLVQTR